MFIVFIAILVLMIASMWKIFEKAGQEGWKALIPIYNAIVLLQIVGKPLWWIILFIIPIVNVVFLIWTTNMLSKSFGKDEGFTAGLLLLGFVFYPMLAFGDAKYMGPFGDPVAYKAFREKASPFYFEKTNVASS